MFLSIHFGCVKKFRIVKTKSSKQKLVNLLIVQDKDFKTQIFILSPFLDGHAIPAVQFQLHIP